MSGLFIGLVNESHQSFTKDYDTCSRDEESKESRLENAVQKQPVFFYTLSDPCNLPPGRNRRCDLLSSANTSHL
jgi:hypothetical protein